MYFDTVYTTFERLNYRPRYHFGKIVNITSAQMKAVYPRLGDFLKIRSKLDPNGIYVNNMLAELLGL